MGPALREASSSVYEALVRQAAQSLVRRIRATSVVIAKHAEQDVGAPMRKELSALVKMWRTLVPGGPSTECPPLAPLLRRQPGLENAPSPALLALVPSFTRQAVAEGEVVFLEGEQGDAMYLIASGSVDVVRHVRGGAKRLVTLTAGGQFGCNALVELGARTASCVAATPCWLYRIDAARFRAPPPQAGLLWWESVLHNLGDQLRRSDDNLRAIVGHAPEPKVEEPVETDALRALLDASGFRNEGDVFSSELEAMEVVFTEDQRRNPIRRD
ncbi:MAG: cyclic nucleotide-binding domain-containing protein [Proteobacteria bacterium]|nr:cyclic nucleotide-binding domain-containing protein [Pseudomonadota bacterium]MCP4916373.1 cyclic nucleotide-binding domain-containing protein [Pseudomonadota bacterium]